ncbi:MAG: hypothetical protein IT170_05260, partial [Bryobacterales bacterium]|nr:hypothetical protein [Bryobacterales bacterium]
MIASPYDPVEKLRSRTIGFDAEALKGLIESARTKADVRSIALPSAELNLFEDTSLPFFAESIRPTNDGIGQVLTGPVGYGHDGQAILTIYRGAMAGSVRLASGEFYQIFVPENGVGDVEQVRFRGYNHNELDFVVPEGAGAPLQPEDRHNAKGSDLAQYANAAGGNSVVDVMVAYTARAREARGGA